MPNPLIFAPDFTLSADGRFASLTTLRDKTTCVRLRLDLAAPGSAPSETAVTDDRRCVHYSDDRRPASRDGRRLIDGTGGATIVASGRASVRLAGTAIRELVDLQVTPDGARAVLVANRRVAVLGGVAGSVAEVRSLVDGRRLSTLRLPGAYASAVWLDATRFALTGFADRGAAAQPALVVEAASGRIVDRVGFRCATTIYGRSGAMLAGRASRCDAGQEALAGLATTGLWVRLSHGAWQPARATGLGAPIIEAVAATADGSRAALLTRRVVGYDHPHAADKGPLRIVPNRIVLIDGDVLGTRARARTLPIRLIDDEGVASIAFTANAACVIVATSARIITYRLADGHQSSFARAFSPSERVLAASDTTVVTTSYDRNQANGYDGGGSPTVLLADAPVMSAGFLAQGLRWTATFDGSIRFYLPDWTPALTLTNAGLAYIAHTPSGRYDSPLGPDSNAFRWWFADESRRSLGGQTFLRDYLEPQLYAKMLACTAADDCPTALPPLPPVSDLNRTLPDVRLAAIRAGPQRGTAVIEVEARSVDRPAANGRTRSGLYNLRLFRDGKLVGQWPAAPSDTSGVDLAGWRRVNALIAGGDGVFRHRFIVRLPTALARRHTEFTAYAFNDDRVKSDTARAGYDRPLGWPAQPVAYLLTIGIDDFAQGRFHLDYAAADAELLARRLADLPGYRVRRLDLRGKGTRQQATGQAIADAVALLAPGDHAAARSRLAAIGVDASGFAPATPDDLVLITFAGHGWADPRGNFFLVPSDARWTEGAASPDLTRLISAAQLSNWLRPIDAGDAALIVDACNSAAVVATAGFKPGPLGDRGLGQLAYDKGILILAASQTDQKAHEDARLGHGFLTAALARDGLDGGGFGHADSNDDGRITLDEWLRYAVARLPALTAEIARDGRGRDFGPIVAAADVAAAAPQTPALFDFAGGPSRVVVGREAWPARVARIGNGLSGLGRAAEYLLSAVRDFFTDTIWGLLTLIAAVVVAVVVGLGAGLVAIVRRRNELTRRRAAPRRHLRHDDEGFAAGDRPRCRADVVARRCTGARRGARADGRHRPLCQQHRARPCRRSQVPRPDRRGQ